MCSFSFGGMVMQRFLSGTGFALKCVAMIALIMAVLAVPTQLSRADDPQSPFCPGDCECNAGCVINVAGRCPGSGCDGNDNCQCFLCHCFAIGEPCLPTGCT